MATSPSDRANRPTPEEVAAIMAAVEIAWPEPPGPPKVAVPGRAGWRFSGRWWGPDDVVRRRS